MRADGVLGAGAGEARGATRGGASRPGDVAGCGPEQRVHDVLLRRVVLHDLGEAEGGGAGGVLRGAEAPGDVEAGDAAVSTRVSRRVMLSLRRDALG